MGCDIHTFVEEYNPKTKEWTIVPEFNHTQQGHEVFSWRDYGVFGFLADVRNYSYVPYISKPRGLPEDCSPLIKEMDYGCDHSHTWLTLKELDDYDYNQIFEDRRCTKEIIPGLTSGAADSGEGNGIKKTLVQFLGEEYFNELRKLRDFATSINLPFEHLRIVFWFDN